MNAIIPYIFFIYIFILTWIVMMNYDNIKTFTKDQLSTVTFISLLISIFVFVAVATLYNIESKNENYKEKIKDITPDFTILL